MKSDNTETADEESFHGYETTTVSGFLIVCPECEAEERFRDGAEVIQSGWGEFEEDGLLLENDYMGFEAPCPEHTELQQLASQETRVTRRMYQ